MKRTNKSSKHKLSESHKVSNKTIQLAKWAKWFVNEVNNENEDQAEEKAEEESEDTYEKESEEVSEEEREDEREPEGYPYRKYPY